MVEIASSPIKLCHLKFQTDYINHFTLFKPFIEFDLRHNKQKTKNIKSLQEIAQFSL